MQLIREIGEVRLYRDANGRYTADGPEWSTLFFGIVTGPGRKEVGRVTVRKRG